ncbi:MAG TPA: tetratricopeptide repeat protein [Gemmatimonadaceae bacterium]|jgi:predicted negative regulator of RcsB-dependent stress response
MTKTGAAARPDLEDRAEDLKEWALIHSKGLSIAAGAILVAVGLAWLYVKSQQAQAQNASAALVQAEQAVGAGNSALAQSDLERIVNRYGSTEAGRQAQLLLSQTYFDAGKYAEGIDNLQKLIQTKPKFVEASAYNLMGAGYEQQNKFDDAAGAYQKAADMATGKSDRDSYLANAARALTAGGKTAEAVKIWSKLATDPTSPAAAEARVRLGELQAKAVKAG